MSARLWIVNTEIRKHSSQWPGVAVCSSVAHAFLTQRLVSAGFSPRCRLGRCGGQGQGRGVRCLWPPVQGDKAAQCSSVQLAVTLPDAAQSYRSCLIHAARASFAYGTGGAPPSAPTHTRAQTSMPVLVRARTLTRSPARHSSTPCCARPHAPAGQCGGDGAGRHRRARSDALHIRLQEEVRRPLRPYKRPSMRLRRGSLHSICLHSHRHGYVLLWASTCVHVHGHGHALHSTRNGTDHKLGSACCCSVSRLHRRRHRIAQPTPAPAARANPAAPQPG